jgi:hypothetical protein
VLLPKWQIQGTAAPLTTGANHGSKIIDLSGVGSEADCEHTNPSAPE